MNTEKEWEEFKLIQVELLKLCQNTYERKLMIIDLVTTMKGAGIEYGFLEQMEQAMSVDVDMVFDIFAERDDISCDKTDIACGVGEWAKTLIKQHSEALEEYLTKKEVLYKKCI